jgi:malonyl-CoA/methylmalonyl-CoA synthetase
LPINEIGNLQVKGDNVFKSYWQMPEKTAEDFTVDGFFNTGDQASIDQDGYISIVGRSKDLIITGGLNVYPKELELLVNDIEGVSESAFIGLPDEDFGESVTAILVLKENQEHSEIDIKAYLKNKIANFKVPKYVFYAEELPRNAMGKVQKNVLREEFSKKI